MVHLTAPQRICVAWSPHGATTNRASPSSRLTGDEMVEKRTDRVQILEFARQGVEIFNNVEQNLQMLVEKVATVNYRGPNARAFKTSCVRLATGFAESTSRTMTQMSNVVEVNTTYIAKALGGEAISLEPPNVAINPPSIDTDESVEAAEDTALSQLRQDIDNIYTTIVSLFEENLANLTKLGVDGWWGPEYDETHDGLTRLTGTVVDACNQSRSGMMKDIQSQIDLLF